MNCSTCANLTTCSELCMDAEEVVSCDYKSMRELLIGSSCIEIVASSCAFIPPDISFPEFPTLKARENEILRLFYQQGLSYSKIAQTAHVKQNTVASILSRAKRKIAKNFSMDRGNHGRKSNV